MHRCAVGLLVASHCVEFGLGRRGFMSLPAGVYVRAQRHQCSDVWNSLLEGDAGCDMLVLPETLAVECFHVTLE